MSYNTVSPVTGYYNMPVRWDWDEKHAPVPGWGMWLADVGYHQDMVGIGAYALSATDPNAPPEVPPTPAPATTPTVSTSLFLVTGAVIAGSILGYMLCKGA